eukprot:4722388-Pyramimonas_sp.AAC.1
MVRASVVVGDESEISVQVVGRSNESRLGLWRSDGVQRVAAGDCRDPTVHRCSVPPSHPHGEPSL